MTARADTPGPGARQWLQVGALTAAAAALFAAVRMLPTGTNLSHMDFRVQGANVIEFCDPANPQFLPVVAVRSPVSLAVATASPPLAGEDVDATLVLTTFSGKPIAPEDLLVVQTRRIHLLIADPSLDDYQHVHPVPGRRPGEWAFRFRPRFGGAYRIFADFTPVATNRGLYSEAELDVAGPPNPAAAGSQPLSWVSERDGYRFELSPASTPVRAGVQANLTLAVRRAAGGPVPLEPLMGAYAHLVAFDAQRSGFAHIHPNPAETDTRPDPGRPSFTFRLMIPRAGRYVIWAEVSLAGRQTYAPFWFDVGG
ncbi:MAG TPA: hypothetical protein VN877_08190 [Opitutaceae bacterium]|nr:hypothetical protein [Opitutaceae bacterium]